MYDEENVVHNPSESTAHRTRKAVTLVIALVCTLVVGYLLRDTRGKISEMELRQAAAQQKSDQRILALESKLQATADTLASQMGMTQQELAEKTEALQASQHAAVSRLSEQQKQAISEVSSEVSGVKSDVAGTKSDLEATNAKLASTIGDLGVQSGLVAHTRDDLEVLKHKGDRNYYDFTLLKGKAPTRVSTVSLQLKGVDVKKNRFTLNVLADDRTVEKKGRNVEEPLQFYTGRDHQLFELVVFTVARNQVTGYLSTPKEAPQPISLLGDAPPTN
jgi:hypothetical protein